MRITIEVDVNGLKVHKAFDSISCWQPIKAAEAFLQEVRKTADAEAHTPTEAPR